MSRKLNSMLVGACLVGTVSIGAFYVVGANPRIDCSEDLLFPAIAQPNSSISAYLDNYQFVDGIPHWDYGGSRGVQVNPYQVAYVATLQLQRYCDTGSKSALRHALLMREWLLEQLKEPSEVNGSIRNTLRIEYEFPNLPYAREPGWGRAFAQVILLNFALRTQPSFSPSDQYVLWQATNALLAPIEEGGLYSNYDEETIFWEEVAAKEPSRIVNAHLIAAWTVDQITDKLPPWFLQRDQLAALNEKAKNLIPTIADQVQYSETHILYDLSSTEPNLRDRSAYAWRMMVAGYRWLIVEGYPLEGNLNALQAMPTNTK